MSQETNRLATSSSIDLSQASDEELLTELAWRGYRIDLAAKKWPHRGMAAHEFREGLQQDYGVKVHFGYRREQFWQALLDCYPNAATFEKIQALCYSGHADPDMRANVASMVCQDNRALRGTPFQIKNVWGVGYKLVRDG